MEDNQLHISVQTTGLMQDDVVMHNGRPVWVKAILNYDEVMVAEDIDSGGWERVPAWELEPAELDEAWLRTLGFEKATGDKYIQPEAPWNGTIKRMGNYWYLIGKEPLYALPTVHSLQHVLRLSGERRLGNAGAKVLQ